MIKYDIYHVFFIYLFMMLLFLLSLPDEQIFFMIILCKIR